MATRQLPISQPACWAWTGAREALAIAEETAWASVTTGDGRGEFQRQIAQVRARWQQRWLVEWQID